MKTNVLLLAAFATLGTPNMLSVEVPNKLGIEFLEVDTGFYSGAFFWQAGHASLMPFNHQAEVLLYDLCDRKIEDGTISFELCSVLDTMRVSLEYVVDSAGHFKSASGIARDLAGQTRAFVYLRFPY